MTTAIRIGLIGDYGEAVTAHQAIPRALELAGDALGATVHFEWVPTEEIEGDLRIRDFDGLWCVPATPYRSMEGALRAIRYARERGRPFLGTCGGFQHAIIEYARNVLGWVDAEHAESAPNAARLVITPLACALVEKTDTIRFQKGSILAARLWLPGSNRGLSLQLWNQFGVFVRYYVRSSPGQRGRSGRRGSGRGTGGASVFRGDIISTGARGFDWENPSHCRGLRSGDGSDTSRQPWPPD